MDFLLLNSCILLIVRIRTAETQDFLQSFIDICTVCLDYIFLKRRGNIVFWIWNSPLLTYFCILKEKWVFYYSIILGMANLLSLLVEDSHLSKGFQLHLFFSKTLFSFLCVTWVISRNFLDTHTHIMHSFLCSFFFPSYGNTLFKIFYTF